MTTQELTQTTEATQTTQAPSISDANLSFSQYEQLRRGDKLEAKEQDPATPSAPTKDAGQKKSVDSDPTENGEVESETDGEDSEEADKAKALDADQDQDKPKKKGGFQKRIDKLNARFADKEREAEYWRQLALKGAGEPKVEAKVDAPKAADAAGKPDPDKFETHAEWVEAVADWKAEQKLKEREQKSEQDRIVSEQQKLVSAHMQRVKSFSEKTKDFDDVIGEVDHIPVSPAVRDIIVSSDNGPELMYELAKNPDDYARICKLSPIAAAREIGKIESKLASASAAEKKPEPPKKLTQAPKPIEPVAGKAQATAKDPETMSFAEYERHRREQLRRKRG